MQPERNTDPVSFGMLHVQCFAEHARAVRMPNREEGLSALPGVGSYGAFILAVAAPRVSASRGFLGLMTAERGESASAVAGALAASSVLAASGRTDVLVVVVAVSVLPRIDIAGFVVVAGVTACHFSLLGLRLTE